MRETTAGLRSSGFFRFIDLKVFLGENALKGQKLLAQGNTLGFYGANLSPCKGKSFKELVNLQGFCPYRAPCWLLFIPRVLPWARSFWAFSPFLNHL